MTGPKIIERFHSRDYRPYWFTETKERICIKIEFDSKGLVWDTNMAAISLFWDTYMAAVTSCENTPLCKTEQRDPCEAHAIP